jgi:hypothetical protein
MEEQPDTDQPDIEWPEWRERRKAERRTYNRRAGDHVQGDVTLWLLGSEYEALTELGRKFGYEDAARFAEDLVRSLLNNPPSTVTKYLESLLTRPTE